MVKKGDSNEKLYTIYIKSVLRGVILSVVLLLVAALIFYFTDLNESFMDTAVWIITIMSICFASIYGANRIGYRGFLHGALIGVFYIAVLAIIAVLAERGQVNVSSYLIMLIMAIVVGMLSGMIGIILKKQE
jgi:putative membrane protein (TIGR04086 family)